VDGIATCVVGDYNQRIPRVSQPPSVALALAGALSTDFKVATAGIQDLEGRLLIDHMAGSPGISIKVTQLIAKRAQEGTKLSDHTGVVASIQLANSVNRRNSNDGKTATHPSQDPIRI
jgi:endonuclease/exonuclease/phosphatase family metal-dependent hydrolase